MYDKKALSTTLLGVSSNGRMPVSKTVNEGSNPSTPVFVKAGLGDRFSVIDKDLDKLFGKYGCSSFAGAIEG